MLASGSYPIVLFFVLSQVNAPGACTGQVAKEEPEWVIWPNLIVAIGEEKQDGDLLHAAAQEFEQIEH